MAEEAGLTDLPPHDDKAEWFLLACLVHRPSLIPAVRIEAFYVNECRRVLLKMQAFWLEKLECLNAPTEFEYELTRALESHYHEPLGRAIQELPSADNWSYWNDVVETAWKARQLLTLPPLITEASVQLQAGNRVPMDRVRRRFNEIETTAGGSVKGIGMDALVPQLVTELETLHQSGGALLGLSTGFQKLDNVTSGLQDGRFYIFAGRPGEGKSSLCMSIAHAVAFAGHPVVYFSLEMPAKELGLRLAACLSRVVTGRFSRGTATDRDFDATAKALLNMKPLPLRIVDTSSSLQDIVSQCHQLKSRNAVKLVIVDYIGRVRIPNFKGNRNDLVTEISNTMKDLAMSLMIPVIAAAQLNRASAKEDRLPGLMDLRDSGSLEQDADFVGLLHSKSKTETDMLVAKNRSGDTGKISFEFRREITRFEPEAIQTPTFQNAPHND